jgi:hypothetical protein
VINRARFQRFELGKRIVGVREEEATGFSITDGGDFAVADTPLDPVARDLNLNPAVGFGTPKSAEAVFSF